MELFFEILGWLLYLLAVFCFVRSIVRAWRSRVLHRVGFFRMARVMKSFATADAIDCIFYAAVASLIIFVIID